MKRKIWTIAALLSITLLSVIAQSQDSDSTQSSNATFTVRPTEQSGSPGYNNPALAYDGSFTTASSVSLTQAIKGATSRLETWFGFPSTPPGATGMTLNINSKATTGRGGTAEISYSLNGGSTFTAVYFVEDTSRGQQTDSIALSNTQDLTKIQVRAQAAAFSDGTFVSTAAHSVYEIWVSGTD